LVITKDYPIRPLGESFTIFGKADPFGIPVPVLIFIAVALILIWMVT
jgi:ribose transport system permease protein